MSCPLQQYIGSLFDAAFPQGNASSIIQTVLDRTQGKIRGNENSYLKGVWGENTDFLKKIIHDYMWLKIIVVSFILASYTIVIHLYEIIMIKKIRKERKKRLIIITELIRK